MLHVCFDDAKSVLFAVLVMLLPSWPPSSVS